MKARPLFLALVLAGGGFASSLPAQLIDLSFDVGTRFRQDYVNTDHYFLFREGVAHFDLRFDGRQPVAGNDYVKIRVTDTDGGLVFSEHRALDRVDHSEYGHVFTFTQQRNTGPVDRRFYENLWLEMTIGEPWVDEFGELMPPDIQINSYSELYVYGWTPMIQYVPPGHGGEFNFDESPTNVVYRLVPVPEPSTYGLAALAMLGALAVWRRRHPRPDRTAA